MMWFIFWIPLILLIAWLIIRLTRAGQSTLRKKDSALEILKRRYASGEITSEEYEQRKKILEDNQVKN